MPLTIDSTTEERIQKQLARGLHHDTDSLLSRALDLLEHEQDWILEHQKAIHASLTANAGNPDVTMRRPPRSETAASAERFSPQQARRQLAARRPGLTRFA